MKTNRNHNPTIVHEVQSDFVCLKENFGINSKMFRGDASIERVEINGGNEFECEYDKWSPNESMR